MIVYVPLLTATVLQHLRVLERVVWPWMVLGGVDGALHVSAGRGKLRKLAAAKKMMESVEHPKPKKIKAEVWDLSK